MLLAGSTREGSEHEEPGVPGAGGVVVARDAGELWQRASPEDPARRGSGEKGVWSGRRPPAPPAPHPRRGCPIAHTTLGPRGTQRAAPAATAGRNEGRGAAGPPPPPHPHPPRREPARPGGPGSRAGDPRPGHAGAGRRALRRPSVPPTPEGRGTPGGEDAATGPREADRGPDPRSGERIGAGGAPATTSADRRRRRQSGQRIGAAAGPGKRDTPGRGPRGAADGERTEADGRTERGTDGVRPCDTNATEPAVEAGVAARHREGDGSKRPGGSESAARAHRGISPPEASQHRGGPEAHPERQTGLSGHPPPPAGGRGRTPHGASRPPPILHPEPQPARENALPPRTSGPPSPHTGNPAVRAKAPPPAPPPSQGSEGTAPPGDATGRRRPGDDTHVRRGRLGPRPQGAGVEGDTGGRTRGTRRKAGSGGEGPASTRSRGHGTGARAPPGDQKHQDTAGPPGKPARDPTATHTRGRSRNAWDAGRSWPSLERAPHPSPAARAGVPSTQPSSIHPSILPQQIRLPSKPDPEAQHPGDTLSSKGGPDRAHHTATGCGSGARAGTTGSSSPRLQGWGSRGRPGSRTPTPPPSPWAHTTGPAAHNTAHTAPHSPDTRQGPAGPSPNSEGGGAGRSRQQAAHGPTAGPVHPSPPFPTGGGGSAHVLWQSPQWPLRTQEGQRLGGPARAANDPRRRTADTWHGAYRAGVVPAATGCPQRGAQGQRPTPPRPTALGSPRRGTTSWVGQTRHTGAGAQAQAGGSSGKGRTRRQLAAHRPGAPRASRDPKSSAADTKGDRVSTYLVAKKTYFGRQNDSRRQRGPSMTRREGPRNLDPATCPQHYPMNIRPGALGGHLAYRSVRVSERGFDFDVHKEKRRKNRQRGASNKTSGPRPGPTPGAQTVLHRAPRTARAGPHPPPD
ncbi:collagen alpha-1(I) chain-like [Cervus canadensis]|uniref:collagen alpha-1(I) chain-like n=1 Tax=Cervus canadensis TaxID=1574408 RepID=UPI001C9E7C00|nr:collagen alpha-1(I) chain-like [Cervus canadensis]